MPVRKSFGATTRSVTTTTAGVAAGFTYLGFARGVVDAEQDFVQEVCYVSNNAIAGTSIRVVQYNAAGTVVNDITTATATTVQGVAVDATLSTNTINTGVNFPWPLSSGDSVLVTATTGTAQTVTTTFTIYPKGV